MKHWMRYVLVCAASTVLAEPPRAGLRFGPTTGKGQSYHLG